MLVTVIALCEDLSDDVNVYRRYGDYMNSTALWLADSVFDSGVDTTIGGRISFADVADWYSTEGFCVASWLELLDNKKWRFISSTYTDSSNMRAT